VLLGGLFVFHRQVLASRGDLARKMEILAAERILMDRLTTELRSAVPTSHFGLVFEGDDTQMVFHYVDVPRVRRLSDGQVIPQSDIRRLTYRLVIEDEKETGADDANRDEIGMVGAYDGYVVRGVERFVQEVLSPPLEDEEEDAVYADRSLFEDFKFLSLRYWTGDAWVYRWQGELPGAVEVTLGLEPLPEGLDPAEYPFETFRRVISLPASMVNNDPPQRSQPSLDDEEGDEDEDFFGGDE